MDIREFNYYQHLAENNLVPLMVCFNDIEHGKLFGDIDEDDRFFIHCIACNSKFYPGITFSDIIRKKIKEISSENIDE